MSTRCVCLFRLLRPPSASQRRLRISAAPRSACSPATGSGSRLPCTVGLAPNRAPGQGWGWLLEAPKGGRVVGVQCMHRAHASACTEDVHTSSRCIASSSTARSLTLSIFSTDQSTPSASFCCRTSRRSSSACSAFISAMNSSAANASAAVLSRRTGLQVRRWSTGRHGGAAACSVYEEQRSGAAPRMRAKVRRPIWLPEGPRTASRKFASMVNCRLDGKESAKA